MNEAPGSAAKVDLAHAPDFELGGLHVSPSASRVRLGDHDERPEPRGDGGVLVLVRAAGATVTRDELVDACWDGRIISDDAISRVTAKVRNLARDLDPPPFVLETIPKVGFRLVAGAEPAASEPPTAPAPAVRAARPWLLVLTAAAVLLAAVGGWALWRTFRPGLPPSQNSRVEVVAFETRQADPQLAQRSAEFSDALVRILATNGFEVAPPGRRRQRQRRRVPRRHRPPRRQRRR